MGGVILGIKWQHQLLRYAAIQIQYTCPGTVSGQRHGKTCGLALKQPALGRCVHGQLIALLTDQKTFPAGVIETGGFDQRQIDTRCTNADVRANPMTVVGFRGETSRLVHHIKLKVEPGIAEQQGKTYGMQAKMGAGSIKILQSVSRYVFKYRLKPKPGCSDTGIGFGPKLQPGRSFAAVMNAVG